jgi:hypothetical protein
MELIINNITGGFLNDILKATAPEREFANYQNIILPELVNAVKKYNDFKDIVLEALRSRKSQPTIKEAFAKCQRDTKCDRDVLVKKLNEREAVLKDCVRLNQKTSEKIDYFMRNKIVDDVAKVVECVSPLQFAHQTAREYTPKVIEETPKVIEETPKVIEETPNVVEDTPKVVEDTPKVVEDTPNIQITITEKDVEQTTDVEEKTTDADAVEVDEVEQTTDEVEVEEETTEDVEETTEDVEVEEETTDEVEEETTDEVEVEEETTDEVEVAEQAPDGKEETTDADAVEVEEEDVSEEEIDVDAEEEEEEVEEFTHKGKKYYVTNTTNGKIYACTAEDDIGDQVGSFKNGKPIFS